MVFTIQSPSQKFSIKLNIQTYESLLILFAFAMIFFLFTQILRFPLWNGTPSTSREMDLRKKSWSEGIVRIGMCEIPTIEINTFLQKQIATGKLSLFFPGWGLSGILAVRLGKGRIWTKWLHSQGIAGL